jgi:hypothetical protein
MKRADQERGWQTNDLEEKRKCENLFYGIFWSRLCWLHYVFLRLFFVYVFMSNCRTPTRSGFRSLLLAVSSLFFFFSFQKQLRTNNTSSTVALLPQPSSTIIIAIITNIQHQHLRVVIFWSPNCKLSTSIFFSPTQK